MKPCRYLPFAALALALLLPAEPLRAAETAETILIRQALERDRSGRRRGDAELVLSAYDEEGFVTWNGNGSIDGRAWTVKHPSRSATASALTTDLAARRYDIERTVLLINVWKELAFATTLDTGAVVEAGQRSAFSETRLWTFRKVDDEWLATGTVTALGDTAAGPGSGTVQASEVSQFLRDEAEAWNSDSAGDIVGSVDENVAILESHFSSNPAKWLLVFGGRAEYETWLAERLEHVDFDLQRTVLHAVAEGDAAVAVTRDRVAATYAAGDARVEQNRTSTWLLHRRGGSWRASWIWWKAKPFDEAEGSSALD